MQVQVQVTGSDIYISAEFIYNNSDKDAEFAILIGNPSSLTPNCVHRSTLAKLQRIHALDFSGQIGSA
jgi:hypothetical protein